jgi:hypothetical protein
MCRKLSADKTSPEYKANLTALIINSVILLAIYGAVSFAGFYLVHLGVGIYNFLVIPKHRPLMIIAVFTIVMFVVALLLAKRQKPQPGLTESEKLTNHHNLRGILCDAIVPVADVLSLKPPTDLTEFNPLTGTKYYDEADGTTVYCYSCNLKADVDISELDTDLIVRTLNSRIIQIMGEGRLPLLANKGIINMDRGSVESPVQIINIQKFPQTIAIYATMYIGV